LHDFWDSLRNGAGSDVIILDTIPFRRQELVYPFLAANSGKRKAILCGHTGWLPYYNNDLISRWRSLLSMLSIRTVLLYHGEDVCHGTCHLTKLARSLGIRVIHAGLLLPPIRNEPNRTGRILISAGGGAGLKGMLPLLSTLVDANPKLNFDVTIGPYGRDADGDLDPRMRRLPFATDMANLLTEYGGSITRAGYGACVDHIVSETPAWFVPLPNAEQNANALWVKPYLAGELSIDEKSRINIHSAHGQKAKSFSATILEECWQ
jgi:hypothetical protein